MSECIRCDTDMPPAILPSTWGWRARCRACGSEWTRHDRDDDGERKAIELLEEIITGLIPDLDAATLLATEIYGAGFRHMEQEIA